MKKLLATLALGFLPTVLVAEPIIVDLKPVNPIIIDHHPDHSHHHDFGAETIARRLVDHLSGASYEASYEANSTSDTYRARQFRQFSRNANTLGREVQRNLVDPLQYGAPFQQILQALRRLDYSFSSLNQQYQSLSMPSYRLQDEMSGAQEMYLRLQDALQSGCDPIGPHPHDPHDPFPGPQPHDPFPGPHPHDPFPGPQPDIGEQISASCQVNISGNFSARSSVACAVYGRGASRYEILVDSRLVWQGRLDTYSQSQRLQTDTRNVGGYQSRYDVYVVTQNGQRQLVYQQ